ncbi:MAG: type IV pilus modification PilV family protein [Betaproteobacteria bacterium]
MNRTTRQQQGVMLLEALIGILIFSIGILALIGMQATAMRATIDAKYRSEASFLANQVLGQMWVADKTNLAAFATSPGIPAACPGAPVCAWITRVGQLLPNATGANAPEIAVSANEVTVTVRWQPPGDAQPSNHLAVTQINGGT